MQRVLRKIHFLPIAIRCLAGEMLCDNAQPLVRISHSEGSISLLSAG